MLAAAVWLACCKPVSMAQWQMFVTIVCPFRQNVAVIKMSCWCSDGLPCCPSNASSTLLYRDDISENIDQNKTELFEEMGVQTDDDVCVSHDAFSKLQTKRRRI